jgi:hypothetical protein
MLFLLETGLTILAILQALTFPGLGSHRFAPLERGFAGLARRRTLSVVAVGMAALSLRLLLLPVLPIPEPAVHDEFSYLLAADTFAHGRLANPTHPMWAHLETFHVNQKPTYVSIYYPGQGLVLAAGQVIMRHPFLGVWLSTGLMCAAICWMLQGWLPPFWALLGGLLAVIRLGTFSYWMNSYWGGSVAALGGALVLGALPRIRRHARVRDASLMGIGFALMANTRPYEGLFFSIPVIAALALWMRKPAIASARVVLARVFVPLLVVCALTLSGMGYYFWRTTGSPIRTPYAVNVATYHPVPFFPWQEVKKAPEYRTLALQSFYTGWRMRQYDLARRSPFVLLLLKAITAWCFFLGPALTLPFFSAGLSAPANLSLAQLSRRTHFFCLVGLSLLVALLLPVAFDPHYAAPGTCVLYYFLLAAMQKVRRWRPWRRPVGPALTRAVPILALLMFALRIVMPPASIDNHVQLATWYSPVVFNTYRAKIVADLDKEEGLHLVIVQYAADHAPQNEWVYNKADIDHSKTVWARDLGEQQNAELIRYFHHRKVWYVQPDKLPPRLQSRPGPQDEPTTENSATLAGH